MQQAEDFRDESDALFDLLSGQPEERLNAPTQFKLWTTNRVLRHLHVWNEMAALQLSDEQRLVAALKSAMRAGNGMAAFEREWVGDLKGRALVDAWRAGAHTTADHFARADPKARLKWVGPDMSARSSITARLMETWAHGQEVYDLCDVARNNTDRIKNIVVLGVNTFAWTYRNRGLPVPDAIPYLELAAPSGEIWTYGTEDAVASIVGPAEDFCQVVTQTRNVADTSLRLEGETAAQWMSMAQCFAGAPNDPPAPGTRFRGPKPRA